MSLSHMTRTALFVLLAAVLARAGAESASSTTASTLTPNDFAQGFEVTPVGDGALQRIRLPADVFRVCVAADLGDLRVFNAAGQAVAFAVDVTATPAAEWSAWRTVAFFALADDNTWLDHTGSDSTGSQNTGSDGDAATNARATTRVDVQLGNDGAVLAIRGRAVDTHKAHRWLLDVSAWRTPLDELEMNWSGGSADALIELRVEGSDDLASWRPLVEHATLARLSYGGNLITQNRAVLPHVYAKYIALRWTARGAANVLTGVLGRSRLGNRPVYQEQHVLSAQLVDGAFEFDAGGRLPIVAVAVWPAQLNDAQRIRLLSRTDARQAWDERARGVAYRVRVNGAERRSEPFTLTTIPARVNAGARYWRVEREAGRFSGADAMALQIYWRPPELLFLRQGDGPFTVAFGAGGVHGIASPVPRLLSDLGSAAPLDVQALPLARAGTTRAYGGDARLAPPPQPLPWQQIALWSVLAAGVVLIGGLAWRMLRSQSPP